MRYSFRDWIAGSLDYQLSVALRYDFPNLVLYLLKDALGRFDTGSCGCTDVKLYLSAIDRRKEISTDQRKHHHSQPEQQNHRDWNDEPVIEKLSE